MREEFNLNFLQLLLLMSTQRGYMLVFNKFLPWLNSFYQHS